MLFSSRRCAQLGLAAAGVVLATCLGILYAHNPGSQPVMLAATPAGDAAPRFHLKDLDGRSYDSERFRGKAVVVFFNSMRCTTCGTYEDRIRDLARQYSGDGRVQFLAMNQDVLTGDQQRLLEVRVFTKVSAVPFPTLLDVGAKTAAAFGASPAQFAVLDHRGAVRYVGGFDDHADPAKVTRHYVAEELRRVLDELPTRVATATAAR